MSVRKATDIFSEWALNGKDLGMQDHHSTAVDAMLETLTSSRSSSFSFVDAGCGNGWVVRKVSKKKLCNKSVGIDGAKQMIANAKARGGEAKYIFADINSYNSPNKYDLIHSMEVLYYLNNPEEIIKKISNSWLNSGGRLIVGIDHYYENSDSHSWQEKVGTRMLMLNESEWVRIFQMSGLSKVQSWRSNKENDWAGTLVITGKK